MKLATVFVALSALTAATIGANAKKGAHSDKDLGMEKPVPWKDIHHKHAKHWAFFYGPKGTDLLKAKPWYDKCKVQKRFASNRKSVFHDFADSKHFEFQQINANTIYVNCIDCTSVDLNHIYSSQISHYIECPGRKTSV